MSDFKHYAKAQRIASLYEDAKSIAISFGADPESFKEADRLTDEIMERAREKVRGGVLTLNEKQSG